MSEHWKSEAKYSQNGVNGSLCSFLVYLSEVRVPTFGLRGCIYICEVWTDKYMLEFLRFVELLSRQVFVSFFNKVEKFCPSQKGHGVLLTNSNDCKIPQKSAAFPKCGEKIVVSTLCTNSSLILKPQSCESR